MGQKRERTEKKGEGEKEKWRVLRKFKVVPMDAIKAYVGVEV